MRLTAGLALLLAIVPACGDDSTGSSAPDLSVPRDMARYGCLAIACTGHCPLGPGASYSRCYITNPNGPLVGACTNNDSTCGVHLNGDCNFTTRCLAPNMLGRPFVVFPEGGCGIEIISCPGGCDDADGGASTPVCR